MKKIILITVFVVLTGCAGTRFQWDSVRQVTIGTTEQQLRDVMGDPYSISSKGDDEIWVYSYANGISGGHRSVSFVLKNGKVTSVPTVPASFD